jgi:hypothetical protein
MRAREQARPAVYEEAHSALNQPFLTYGLFAPVAAEVALLILAITVSPNVFSGLVGGMFVPVLIYMSLLYRNWPTGIRLDESGVSIGAIRSSRARSRTPTANHQSWGLFSCPWPSVSAVHVVIDAAEIRRLRKSQRYCTLNNRWGSRSPMPYCNIGVLTPPFMRAALVIDIYPSGVTATRIRPSRYYSKSRAGRSHFIEPRMSSTWIVPTRDPEGLRQALETLGRAGDSRHDPFGRMNEDSTG